MKSTEHFDPLPSEGTAGEVHTSNGRAGPLDVLSKFQEDVSDAGGRLLEVYKDRARLSTRRALVACIGWLGAAVFAAVALGSAAVAVTSGTCGALTELFGGRVWLGNLTGGLALLLMFGLVLVLVKHVSERRTLKALRTKYGDSDHEHTPANDSDSVAAHSSRSER